MRNDTRLKQLLNKYNVTQQSFANILCVTKYTAWKIINNKRPLRSDEIVKICERFNVSADWLLGLKESSNPRDIEALDKIKAEIVKVWRTNPKNRYEEGLKDQALKDVQIIDKYKAESGE